MYFNQAHNLHKGFTFWKKSIISGTQMVELRINLSRLFYPELSESQQCIRDFEFKVLRFNYLLIYSCFKKWRKKMSNIESTFYGEIYWPINNTIFFQKRSKMRVNVAQAFLLKHASEMKYKMKLTWNGLYLLCMQMCLIYLFLSMWNQAQPSYFHFSFS